MDGGMDGGMDGWMDGCMNFQPRELPSQTTYKHGMILLMVKILQHPLYIYTYIYMYIDV